MSRFAIHNPYFIVVVCLIIAVVGITSLVRMPVDMFPAMNIPVVVVATFYPACRRSRSRPISPAVSSASSRWAAASSISNRVTAGRAIKVYFQPGTNPDSAVTTISNLAGPIATSAAWDAAAGGSEIRRFQPAGVPGDIQRRRIDETQLRDLAQFQVRNQIASVPGASVPQPFMDDIGRLWSIPRSAQTGSAPVEPDGRRASLNAANLILPAGDVQLGLPDYNIYTNSQLRSVSEINDLPLKTVGQAPVRVADIGYAKDAQQIQTNMVRVDGQRSVYVPVLKQGGDTNTIAVVDGISRPCGTCSTCPSNSSHGWYSISRFCQDGN